MRFSALVFCVAICVNCFLPVEGSIAQDTSAEICVQGNQIVSKTRGPLVLKGVNFEGSWKYSQGEKLDEVAKTGANSVRIVWNLWQNTDNLSLVMNSAIENGLLPILELHDSTTGHYLSSTVGDRDAFRQVVSWWVSEDVKNVLLPLQDKMIVNIANETFRTHYGFTGFVEEYTFAIEQLRGAGYTTHFMIDGPDWGQDYVGGVERLRELQKVDSNISLGVHLYDAFLDSNSIDELFRYMEDSQVPWSVGEFSIQTPGCRGEIDFQKVMSLANQYNVGYQAWSWGHGNADCIVMDMTVPNGDFANLTAWGQVVANDLADSVSFFEPPIHEVEEVDPSILIPNMIAYIDALIDTGSLPADLGEPVNNFLDQGLYRFERGEYLFAIARLDIVIRRMEWLVRRETLTAEEANPIVVDAECLIEYAMTEPDTDESSVDPPVFGEPEPSSYIPAMIAYIDTLIATETLSAELGEPINDFLDQGLSRYERGEDLFAIARLEIVIRRMEWLVRRKTLTSELASPIITNTRRLIEFTLANQ